MARARGNTCHETPVAQNFFASLAHEHRVTKPRYLLAMSVWQYEYLSSFISTYSAIVLSDVHIYMGMHFHGRDWNVYALILCSILKQLTFVRKMNRLAIDGIA